MDRKNLWKSRFRKNTSRDFPTEQELGYLALMEKLLFSQANHGKPWASVVFFKSHCFELYWLVQKNLRLNSYISRLCCSKQTCLNSHVFATSGLKKKDGARDTCAKFSAPNHMVWRWKTSVRKTIGVWLGNLKRYQNSGSWASWFCLKSIGRRGRYDSKRFKTLITEQYGFDILTSKERGYD